MTIEQLYHQAIEPLPEADRRRLADLILRALSPAGVNIADEWSEEDLRDFGAASWDLAGRSLGDEGDA